MTPCQFMFVVKAEVKNELILEQNTNDKSFKILQKFLRRYKILVQKSLQVFFKARRKYSFFGKTVLQPSLRDFCTN